MLLVGENSFISLEDANEYITTHFTSDDEYRVKWESLSDSDKEVWLRRSTQALNNLKFVGRKKGVQKLEFPRVVNLGIGGYIPTLFTSQFYDNGLISANGPSGDEDGMIAIGKACVENAIAGAYLNNVVTSTRIASIQGLTAMKAGNVSKSYSRNNRATVNSENDIFTDKIYSILVDWLQSAKYSL